MAASAEDAREAPLLEGSGIFKYFGAITALNDVSFHLKRGDYSKWLREAVKDSDLAEEVAVIERDETLSASKSRSKVTQSIQRRYTLPA